MKITTRTYTCDVCGKSESFSKPHQSYRTPDDPDVRVEWLRELNWQFVILETHVGFNEEEGRADRKDWQQTRCPECVAELLASSPFREDGTDRW